MIGHFKQAIRLTFVVLVLTAGACQEDPEPYTVYVSERYLNGVECWDKSQIEGVTVKLYATEEDYLFDENVVAETQTTTIRAEFNVPEKTYWFSASKGGNTHHRFTKNSEPNVVTPTDKSGRCTLGPKPIQLQLRLKNKNLSPLPQGYEVVLFDTESDFINNKPLHEGNRFAYSCLNISSSKYTDSEGIVFFPNLEPKQYWFKIRKAGGVELSASIVKTPEPLPDDMNIVTSLDVIVDL